MGQKYGFSFSWKRALGISGAKARLSRQIGIPLTRSGRQRKLGRMMTGGQCFVVTACFGKWNHWGSAEKPAMLSSRSHLQRNALCTTGLRSVVEAVTATRSKRRMCRVSTDLDLPAWSGCGRSRVLRRGVSSMVTCRAASPGAWTEAPGRKTATTHQAEAKVNICYCVKQKHPQKRRKIATQVNSPCAATNIGIGRCGGCPEEF
jgi:hypothetical protein